MGDVIAVPFAGEGSGEDELSWGQRNIWNTIRRWGPLNVVGVMPVPPTTTVEEVVGVLSYVSGRHQSLRTRFRIDSNGRPRQTVHETGVTALEVIDVETVDPVELTARYRDSAFSGESELTLANPACASPEEVAEAVKMRFHDGFDDPNEWPLRMAVIRREGTVTQVVVGYNHLVIDGEGLAALVRDLSTMDSAVPLDGLSPLEQVRLQRTPAHRKHSDAALSHWEKVLRAIPARRFGEPVQPQRRRYWELEFSSPAAYLATRAISARGEKGSGPTVLAAFAVALHRVTGLSPTVAQMLVNNRFRPGLADSVSPLNQPAICVVDVEGVPFDDVVTSAWRTTMAAGLHAYYDMTRYEDLIATVTHERGEDIDLSCFYSDRGVGLRLADTSPVPTPDEVRAALSRTTTRWRRQKDQPNDRLYFHVGDTADTLDLMLAADTMYLPPDDMMRLVREMEAVLVEAATRQDELAAAGH